MPRRHPFLPPAILFVAAALALLAPRDHGVAPVPLHQAFGHGPTVVLVHGLGSRSEHWLPVARTLSRRFRVVLVELPGHGDSGMPAPFSLERAVASLDRALAEAAAGPVVLVGHSVGGLVAAAEAVEQPRRVRRLVLVDAALRPQADAETRAAMLRELDEDYDGLLKRAYLAFGRDSIQGERLYRDVAGLDPANVKPWIRLALTADLSGRTARLTMPVLAIFAPHSWEPDETWEHAAEALGYSDVPDVEPLRLGPAGHFIMLDRPAELARAIERFALDAENAPVAAR